jgi:hypothetical protein
MPGHSVSASALDLGAIVRAAFERPFRLKSDLARREAAAVAEAALRGYITTLDASGAHGALWRSTWTGEKAFGL